MRNFHPMINAPDLANDALWFIFSDQKLLVYQKTDSAALPVTDQIAGENRINTLFLGRLGMIDCYCAELVASELKNHDLKFQEMRNLFGTLPEDQFAVAGRALQMLHWHKIHMYCGQCGTKTVASETEFAKICPNCGLSSYPRINPVIIVAIVRGESILLARRKGSQMYSVVAGFVEAGETLEECVIREVQEEVGIAIDSIRYFGSQPWAFSSSLMVGFTALYSHGEIRVDEVEIEEAHWFRADRLPLVPGPYSIARKLIDWFVNQQL